MEPVPAAGVLLVVTGLFGVAALTTRAGSWIGRVATAGMTGSVVVVASIMVAALLGAGLPTEAAVLLAGCTTVVLGTSLVQARRLARRINALASEQRRTARRTAPWN